MKTFAVLALTACIASASISEEIKPRRVSKDMPCRVKPAVLAAPRVSKPLPEVDLPDQWLWSNVEGNNLLTTVRQQHIPQYCGSCWAQAAASSLSDRIKIARRGAWPEINIAPQVLISCEIPDDGCHGGYAYNAFAWMADNEITDETCSIYRARGHDNGIACSAMTMCRNCNPGEACFVPDEYNVYGVEEYGMVTGEYDMMQQIYQSGPIACGIAVPEALEEYTGGIFCDDTGDMEIVHDISVVGYGEEDGQKYWMVRNSWGTEWGERGFFRVCRGLNNIAIESDCAWATPKDTWTEPVMHQTTDAEKNDPFNDNTPYTFPQPEYTAETNEFKEFADGLEMKGCRAEEAKFRFGDLKTTPYSWDLIKEEDLPSGIDWRNKDGVNYLSWNKNQHIPQYCGSCWSEGTSSAIADRFNILDAGTATSPHAISAQMVVNCYAGGSCNGGNPAQVYEFANEVGLVHGSCMNYVAYNNVNGSCEDINVCRDCTWPPPPSWDDGLDGCRAIEPKRYYISEYYNVKGAGQMKAELLNGPISCGIHVTDNFEWNYDGTYIYEEDVRFILLNHEISVVGYGVTDEGQEYWIGRNSWGTYWADYGFFYINMYTNNLGIERNCVAGVPSHEKPTVTANSTATPFTQ